MPVRNAKMKVSTLSDEMLVMRILLSSPLAVCLIAKTTLGPLPLYSATYEVSRYHFKSAAVQMQMNLMAITEMMLKQRQQQIEDEQIVLVQMILIQTKRLSKIVCYVLYSFFINWQNKHSG